MAWRSMRCRRQKIHRCGRSRRVDDANQAAVGEEAAALRDDARIGGASLPADARVVAQGGGFLADGDLLRRRARGSAASPSPPAPPRAPSHEPVDLVDPQPDSGAAAVHPPDAARVDEFSGDENPELPRHRPAHRDRVRRAARRRAGATRDRGCAQDREFDCERRRPQAHLYQDPGRHGDRHRRVPPGEGHREAVDDVRDAVTRVRSDLPQDLREPIVSKLDIAGMPSSPTRSPASGWTKRRCPGSSTTTSPRRCSRCPAWARWRASAASRARSASNSTRRGCRRSTSRRPTSRGAVRAGAAGVVGRPGRHRRQRAVGPHHRHGGHGRGDRPPRDPAARRPAGSPRAVATVTDTIAERRAAALLDGKQVVGFEIRRSRGAERGDGGRAACAQASRSWKARIRTSSSPRPSTSSSRSSRATTAR